MKLTNKILSIASGAYNKALDLWQWLDGKKTTIGTVMLLGSKLFPEQTFAHQALDLGGELLGGIGILHKGQKNLPSGMAKAKEIITKLKRN